MGDTREAQHAIDSSARQVATDAVGPAVVIASTVVTDRNGGPRAVPVVARLEDGRQVGAAAEDDELAALAGCNLVGERIVVSGPLPRFRMAG